MDLTPLMTLKPIGQVSSCYPDKFGTPRQPGLVSEATALITIFPEFQPEESLQGLDAFSHLWILFWFHKNNFSRFHAKVHPPRLQGEAKGVFATRSPHRPNPVGLSLVEFVRIDEKGLWVRGVDFISGTPVIDIKPYLPAVESKADASSGWTTEVVPEEILIEWELEALQSLSKWEKQSAHPDLRVLIEKTLQLDPRPTVYKGYEVDNADSPYRNEHAVRFFDGDVHFKFIGKNRICVLRLTYEN